MFALVRPSQVLFSHDAISCEFSCGRRVMDTFHDLSNGLTSLDQMPMMKIAAIDAAASLTGSLMHNPHECYWAASGNRRLYVYRKLEAEGLCDYIECQLVPHQLSNEALSTRSGGDSVFMRPARGSRERSIPLYCQGCRQRGATCARGFCCLCCPAHSLRYCAAHFHQDAVELPLMPPSVLTESLSLAAVGAQPQARSRKRQARRLRMSWKQNGMPADVAIEIGAYAYHLLCGRPKAEFLAEHSTHRS
eukprot:TRINITY_DN67060_c0_g1_i1.p1 TRINITY_DN67060_c0_g1~~TRINITY_DN67060_c0_g1_i1.p1  ORF type:complete len:248 (+),score=12.08 TRINITY_DN67060_c0_g1_i1:27-770(+)